MKSTEFFLFRSALLYHTRNSSCVNARGIPTAAYEALHLLSCTGGVPPAGGYPIWTWQGYSHPRLDGGTPLSGTGWGTPPPVVPGWGTPTGQVGYPLAGHGWGTPTPQLDPAAVPTPPPLRPGQVGYPLPWTDRRMDRHVSKHNLPSYAVGTNGQ